MTSPAFCTVADVRTLIDLEADGTSKYGNGTIQSNIYAASEFIEKSCNRYFGNRSGITLTLTTNGEAAISLPGVRAITSVLKDGSALTANETYYLIPDDQQSGVYTGLQFRAYGPYGLPSTWFDRGYDLPDFQRRVGLGSLPNDLTVVADVGYLDADLPQMLRLVTKALAGALTLYGPSVLTGTLVTPEGNTLATSAWDLFEAFKKDWKLGDLMAVSL